MGDFTLPPPLSRHLRENFGQFSPFTYSVGLTGSLEAALDFYSGEALPESPSDEALAALVRTLIFEHESLHLAQFVGTSYGLRTLRRTNIAIRYLNELQPFHIPVLEDHHSRIAVDEYSEALARFVAFLDSVDQLQLQRYDVMASTEARGDDRESVTVSMEPYTPLFLIWQFPDLETRRSAAMEMAETAQVHRLPVLYFDARERTQAVVVNAAALMESFAIVREIELLRGVWAAKPAMVNEYYRELSSTDSKGYCALHQLAIAQFESDSPGLDGYAQSLMFSVLVDVALMYDPFVLHDAPFIDKPEPGQVGDELPGEVFIRALTASRSVSPMVESSEEEVERYYEAIAAAMEIPSPSAMAAKALDVASALYERSTGAILHRAFEMHYLALKVRCEAPSVFPGWMLGGRAVEKVVAPLLHHITFYDITSAAPLLIDPENLDALVAHGTVWQALSRDSLECPLAMGAPFYCSNDGSCPWADRCFAEEVRRSWIVRTETDRSPSQ